MISQRKEENMELTVNWQEVVARKRNTKEIHWGTWDRNGKKLIFANLMTSMCGNSAFFLPCVVRWLSCSFIFWCNLNKVQNTKWLSFFKSRKFSVLWMRNYLSGFGSYRPKIAPDKDPCKNPDQTTATEFNRKICEIISDFCIILTFYAVKKNYKFFTMSWLRIRSNRESGSF